MDIIKIIFTITICVEIAASIIVAISIWIFVKDEMDKKYKVIMICVASLFSLAPIIQLFVCIYHFLGSIYEIFLR